MPVKEMPVKEIAVDEMAAQEMTRQAWDSVMVQKTATPFTAFSGDDIHVVEEDSPLTLEPTTSFLPIFYLNGHEPINYEDIITEDDEPVDNIPSEKSQRLAVNSLYNANHLARPFVALANVGLHYHPKTYAIVPDIMLSLNTDLADGSEIWDKENRTYYLWKHGKPPEVVVEIVSNNKGNEAGTKFETYAQIGVQYYVILDYNHKVQTETLVVHELIDGEYIARPDYRLEQVNLSLGMWHGEFEDFTFEWLRWYTLDGDMLLTGQEEKAVERTRREEERQRAEEERQRAEIEQRRADEERQRAEAQALRAEEERQRAEAQEQRAEAQQRRADEAESAARQERERTEQLMALLQAQGIDTAHLLGMLDNV
ncbi:MAG: Uma2 family endonuclease [Chloroflexota bacterium]